MTDVRIRPIEGTDFYYGKLAHLKVVVDENGYMNGTKLAQSAGKQLKLWTRLAGTQSYKQVIFDQLKESGVQICTIADLEYVHTGGQNREINGTYLHPKLMVKFAMWCSDVYGAFVTDVMLAHHTQETERARAKMEAKLADKKAKLKERDTKIAKKKAKISKLDRLLAEIRAENERYREEAMERDRRHHEEAAKRDRRARRRARRADAKMDNIQGDLVEVKDELHTVNGQLDNVSRQLKVAKHQRVPPAQRHESGHRLLGLRLNVGKKEEEDSEDSDDSESEEESHPFTHAFLRVQEKSLSSCLARKRRRYPNAEVILDLETPNSMNLYNRFKEKYAHRIVWDGIDVRPTGSYTEDKMIRDMTRLHETRMTDHQLARR